MAHSDQTTRMFVGHFLYMYTVCMDYQQSQGIGKETLKLAGRRVKNDELVFSNPWITHISN